MFFVKPNGHQNKQSHATVAFSTNSMAKADLIAYSTTSSKELILASLNNHYTS